MKSTWTFRLSNNNNNNSLYLRSIQHTYISMYECNLYCADVWGMRDKNTSSHHTLVADYMRYEYSKKEVGR